MPDKDGLTLEVGDPVMIDGRGDDGVTGTIVRAEGASSYVVKLDAGDTEPIVVEGSALTFMGDVEGDVDDGRDDLDEESVGIETPLSWSGGAP